jgi:transaldolase
MQLFLDTADEHEIEHWLETGVIDGVTTNPTILLDKGWSDPAAGIRRIARLIAPRPVSVEVWAVQPDEMIEQAGRLASWADNVVVKIPVIGENGRPYLDVVHTLESHGVRVNCTACLSFCQGLLASKAGATYVSLLSGRIDDEGGNGPDTVGRLSHWLDESGSDSRVIVGSVRCPRDFQSSAQAGAHIITVPPAILTKIVDHRYSRETAAQFTRDGVSAAEGWPVNVAPAVATAAKS